MPFHQLGPTGPSWSVSCHVRMYVCLRHRVQFFLGLSLALRSHDQFRPLIGPPSPPHPPPLSNHSSRSIFKFVSQIQESRFVFESYIRSLSLCTNQTTGVEHYAQVRQQSKIMHNHDTRSLDLCTRQTKGAQLYTQF